jgi:hypothetical protein
MGLLNFLFPTLTLKGPATGAFFLRPIALVPKFCEKAQCFAVGQYSSR